MKLRIKQPKKIKHHLVGGPYHGKDIYLSGPTMVFTVKGMTGRYAGVYHDFHWETVNVR